ncbi:MAG: toxin-antitoxin system HicB family antitoxin [Thiotrichales bacterium]|nr:MAG: toxin-antitoxin system HicB family antitoxin [Thiotrichales bacterium]
MSTLSLRLPNSLHEAAKQLARADKISMNQFIALAVAEKLSALKTNDYLQVRSAKGNRKKFIDILKNAPDVNPPTQDLLDI